MTGVRSGTRVDQLLDLRRRIDLELQRLGHRDQHRGQPPAPQRQRTPADDATDRAVHLAAHRWDTEPTFIQSRDRRPHVVEARHVAMTALLHAGLSSVQVGRALGRDHSTVLAARDRCYAHPELYAAAEEIAQQLAARPTLRTA